MEDNRFSRLSLTTPYYLVERERIEENCRVLAEISDRTGCRILLALKGFAMFSLFPLIGKYLQVDGPLANTGV